MEHSTDCLANRMSSRQLLGWMAYAETEPFGEWRDDLRFAQLMCIQANTNRDHEAKPEPFTVEDFMPHFGVDREEMPAARNDDCDEVSAQNNWQSLRSAFHWTGGAA